MTTFQFIQHGSLWIAQVATSYGHMELLCGEGDTPDRKVLTLVETFLAGDVDHIAMIRRDVFKMPILWRPIRFAVNNQGRLGLQFKHRISGAQQGMFFADDHSSFTTSLNDVIITDRN